MERYNTWKIEIKRNIPEKLKWKEIYFKNLNRKKYTGKIEMERYNTWKIDMERNILEKLRWKDI